MVSAVGVARKVGNASSVSDGLAVSAISSGVSLGNSVSVAATVPFVGATVGVRGPPLGATKIKANARQ
jgi:hypothetical protein